MGLTWSLRVVLAVAGRWRGGLLGLLALFGDTVYFLLVAGNCAERLSVAGSILFLSTC